MRVKCHDFLDPGLSEKSFEKEIGNGQDLEPTNSILSICFSLFFFNIFFRLRVILRYLKLFVDVQVNLIKSQFEFDE